MTEPIDRDPPGRGRRATRKRRPSVRAVAFVMVGAVVVVALTVGWLGLRGLSARRHLEDARTATEALRAAVLAGDTAKAKSALGDVQADTSSARRLTADPVWTGVAAVPIVGRNVRAVTTTTDVVDSIAQDVLPTLVAESAALDPSSIRVAGDRLDLSRIEQAQPQLARAKERAADAAARLRRVETANLPASLRQAIARTQDEVDDLALLTTNAEAAARLMPPMLGADGPRRYFMAFQTNAEARATGGLVGAYAVLEADRGRLTIRTLGPRSELDSGNLAKPAVDLGAEYRSLYGDDPGWWVNTNLSPHFPYAAKLWLAMYAKQGGGRLDGAIATDPVALGHLLGATGPVTLADGTKVTAANAGSLTMSKVYKQIPDDDRKRDEFLQEVARAVLSNVFAGKGDATDVANALGRSATEGRLLVYSTDRAEQAELETTALGGSAAAAPGPHVTVAVNNGSGSKLDYYLDQSVDYSLGACTSASSRASKVTLSMTNTAPASGLPSYVTTRLDRHGLGGGAAATARTAVGTNLDLVAVHLPVGAVVTAARIDGAPLDLSPQTELGRPVVTFPVLLGPGEERVVVLDLSEPQSTAVPTVRVQPFAQPAKATVTGRPCR